jgi:hypothetical protein
VRKKNVSTLLLVQLAIPWPILCGTYKERVLRVLSVLEAAEALTMKEGEGKLKTSFALTPGMEHSMLDRQASISSGI